MPKPNTFPKPELVFVIKKKLSYIHQTGLFLGRFFTPLALACMIYFLWIYRETFVFLIKNAQISFLLTSVFIWMIGHFCMAWGTWISARTSGVNISYVFAFRTYVTRLPARYLPGGIWHTASRVMDFSRQGINHPQLTALFVFEYFFVLSIAFSMGGAGLYYFQGQTYWGWIALMSMVGGIVSIFSMPYIINRMLLVAPHGIDGRSYFWGLIIYLYIWMVLSASFVFYLTSFPSLTQNIPLLEIISTYMFAWAIGFVSFFAPQGIGVFEVVSGNLLNPSLHLASVAVLIAGFRIVIFIGDMTLWSLLKIYHYFFNNHI